MNSKTIIHFLSTYLMYLIFSNYSFGTKFRLKNQYSESYESNMSLVNIQRLRGRKFQSLKISRAKYQNIQRTYFKHI